MTKTTSFTKELTLMVALDLTPMDPILLRYVSFLSGIFDIKKIYFTHNIKQSELSGLYEDFFKEGTTIESIVERELKRSTFESYTGTAPHTLLITADNYTEGILTHLAKEYRVDVVVTGNKNALQGTGAMSKKLVRMLPAHLLLVPEEARNSLRHILVPTDFSADSALSFEAANKLAEAAAGDIEALHVYGIPSFYFPYIDTDKAHNQTKLHLHDRFDQFQKKHRLPQNVTFKYIDKQDASIVDVIEQEAERGNFDMIVVSARGANNLTSLFIGSTTNDLLLRNRKMPLLIVKKR